MIEHLLHHRGTTIVRRLSLEPGEATPWHRDPYHRVTVVLSGDVLTIEFSDRGEPHVAHVIAGQTDWDEPGDRVHRAVNTGQILYDEIAIFFLDRPDAVPQPVAVNEAPPPMREGDR